MGIRIGPRTAVFVVLAALPVRRGAAFVSDPTQRPFVALVTAAGASTRMGRAKALVPWLGQPLLLHQARVLERCARMGELVAVVGSDHDAIAEAHRGWRTRLRLVGNVDWQSGRSSSLEVGARAFADRQPVGVLVVAVDQPLVLAVVEALVAVPPAPGEAIVPTHGGRRGHPVVLAGSLLAALACASRYPLGLRDIVRGARVREVEVDGTAIHLDLNHMHELIAAEEQR